MNALQSEPMPKDLRFINLTWEIFGRLTVLGFAGNFRLKSGQNNPKWHCVCECGDRVTIAGGHLKKGKTKSCGCLLRDMNIATNTTHGGTGTPTYKTWESIKRRTSNPNSKDFANYGGRGIKMCERWKSSFLNFLQDMGHRTSNIHSIDRKDNNGNYEPGNCRWATRIVQANNSRSNRIINHSGKSMTVSQWAREKGISSGVIYNRIRRNWPQSKLLDPILTKGI